MNSWYFLDSGCDAPAMNMALDEALLRHAAEVAVPVLRFYGWSSPAATFGYFQKIAEVESATPLRPLIRRPTGGGIVPHNDDWTYSLVVPVGHEWHRLRAEESYRRMHEWIQSALAAVGVCVELAPCCRRELAGQCFRGHEKFDLLHHGRKLAGAAQRRNRSGLLIQGSIQPRPAGVTREQFVRAMINEGVNLFRGPAVPLDASFLDSDAMNLVRSRYGREDFIRRR